MGYLDNAGLDHLWGRINEALSNKQDKLTGAPGQVLGFDAAGNAAGRCSWSDPNLLDNWYFADPINQRGQTEYIGPYKTYGIDRWYATGATMTVTVEEGAVRVADTGGRIQFRQDLEDGTKLRGETLTFSCMIRKERPGSVRIGIYHGSPNSVYFASKTTDLGDDLQLISVTGTVPEDADTSMGVYFDPIGSSAELYAAKLELGAGQTLAHQDASGKWVLRDVPPDKVQELAKCQRYYTKTRVSRVPCMIYNLSDTCMLWASVKLPAAMRMSRPSIKDFSINDWVYHQGRSYDPNGIAVKGVEVTADGSASKDGNVAFSVALERPLNNYANAALGMIASVTFTLDANL